MIKIMIVDDDEKTCVRLANFFKGFGHTTFVVSNPKEALPIIEEEAPHVVLLDIFMPQVNGLDVLKQIKEKYGNTIKVVMVTVASEEDSKTKQQALDLGADDFIHKPWDAPYLRDVVMRKIEEVLGYREDGALNLDIPNILIVDDETETVERLKYFLDRIIKCNVETAEKGDIALDMIRKKDYDLIILDLRMPGLSGEGVIKEIKKEKPLPDILVVTGYTNVEKAQEVIQDGAIDCIPKPIYLEAFKTNIKKVLEKKGKYIEKGA